MGNSIDERVKRLRVPASSVKRKGKSTLIMLEKHENLKYKYGNREF